MRAKLSFLTPLALVVLFALTMPVTAAAKPLHIRLPGGFTVSAKLPRSHGYALTLASSGHRKIEITAARGETSFTVTAPGHASRHGIKANLGRFGRVDVRFNQIGKPEKRPPLSFCTGKDGVGLRGVLRGTIRFRGRQGFASTDVTHAPAKIIHDPTRTCGRAAAGAALPELEVEGLTFIASQHAHGRKVSVFAIQVEEEEEEEKEGEEEFGLTLIFASANRHFGRVRTQSLAVASDGFSASAPKVTPATASLFGIAPLRGEASYSSDLPRPERWQGTLQASLPGEGLVPLAGKGFLAALCRGKTLGQLTHCIEQGVAQTSGSQSQSLLAARLSWSR